ncbi:hypothetical protein [Methanocorpusculum vombati]|uniref:Uncharacterized protein n=1 Tax=Methanocorpusculum vombati TaxID=3002864 RepID=A0ABT4IK97_9EURY|nr:hypothetical protein [Methanocorpusculum vombati]MCZ9320062.1 hypothetical protein [Methanocorpusculum sp.]MCZ0861946.1 hypothetical protein [Methanocorpusculum vombati]MDE2520201.1 hypothetical protein [Methanocorpusculum sp.]MDE2534734.1 hypothetical protein [Methanocorpusculum sp.]MDE2545929.1 hypothetical protein [Methanocorpusculum sp.]
MSRSTLTAIVITTLCFAIAIASLGLASLYIETDGLSIVSHGIHIVPQNEEDVIKKMEQLAEENYRYWLNTPRTGVVKNTFFGTVITMKYAEPIGITWTEDLGIEGIHPTSIPVLVDRIIAVIPDDPKGDFRLIVYRPSPDPERYNPDRYIFVMSCEQANELLNLIGKKPITITQE